MDSRRECEFLQFHRRHNLLRAPEERPLPLFSRLHPLLPFLPSAHPFAQQFYWLEAQEERLLPLLPYLRPSYITGGASAELLAQSKQPGGRGFEPTPERAFARYFTGTGTHSKLLMSTLHIAFVLDKPPWIQSKLNGHHKKDKTEMSSANYYTNWVFSPERGWFKKALQSEFLYGQQAGIAQLL
jgi:hypothetical protein